MSTPDHVDNTLYSLRDRVYAIHGDSENARELVGISKFALDLLGQVVCECGEDPGDFIDDDFIQGRRAMKHDILDMLDARIRFAEGGT